MILYNVKKDVRADNVGTKSKAETAGFIPHHIRIQNLIDAGIRLKTSRSAASYYDYVDGKYDEDAPIPDITRRANYDMSDAFIDAQNLKQKLQRKEAEAKEVKKKEAETKEVKRKEIESKDSEKTTP